MKQDANHTSNKLVPVHCYTFSFMMEISSSFMIIHDLYSFSGLIKIKNSHHPSRLGPWAPRTPRTPWRPRPPRPPEPPRPRMAPTVRRSRALQRLRRLRERRQQRPRCATRLTLDSSSHWVPQELEGLIHPIYIVVSGLEHFLFSPTRLGMIIQSDFHIFQSGWNHQPV